MTKYYYLHYIYLVKYGVIINISRYLTIKIEYV